MVCRDVGRWVEPQGTLASHLYFWSTDVLLLEEELAVEIAHLDRIQINLQGDNTCKL